MTPNLMARLRLQLMMTLAALTAPLIATAQQTPPCPSLRRSLH